MYPLKKQTHFALSYFLFIALLGVLLRLFQVTDVPFDYRHLVHTHSHVALLGWVYTGFSVLIYKLYLYNSSIESKFNRLFWATQLTVVGMLITFPFMGYALFSILFSSLFILCSYILARLVFKNTSEINKQSYSYRCIRMALWYMILSSIGPWSLGVIMSTLGNASDLYRNAIYFYLHFQYNGWFIMCIFAVLFYILEQKQVNIPKKVFIRFISLINFGILATFGVSLLWMSPPYWVYLVSGIGGVSQIIAFGILLSGLRPFWHRIKTVLSPLFRHVLKGLGVAYGVKLGLQLLGAFPDISSIISVNTDFIIGYIHWIFLGIISPALLLFLSYFGYINLTKKKAQLYFTGVLLTEGLIIYKGITVWTNQSLFEWYFWGLIIASCILAFSIINLFNICKIKT